MICDTPKKFKISIKSWIRVWINPYPDVKTELRKKNKE